MTYDPNIAKRNRWVNIALNSIDSELYAFNRPVTKRYFEQIYSIGFNHGIDFIIKARIIQKNLDGEVMHIYPNIEELSRILNISMKALLRYIRTKSIIHTTKGHNVTFEFEIKK